MKQYGTGFTGNSFSYILLIILLFNVFGYNIYFNMLQNSIRRDISEHISKGVRDSELTIIEVSSQVANEMTWIKPQKEFSYRGSLYDVVRISKHDGRIVFHCINDTKESKLIKAYAGNEESRQKNRKLLNTISFNYIAEEKADPFIVETSNHEYHTLPFILISTSKEISDPPPKYFLQS